MRGTEKFYFVKNDKRTSVSLSSNVFLHFCRTVLGQKSINRDEGRKFIYEKIHLWISSGLHEEDFDSHDLEENILMEIEYAFEALLENQKIKPADLSLLECDFD